MSSHQRGFTLIELMVVLTIAVVMFGIGMPSFKSLLAGQRVKVLTGSFVRDAVWAQSEAINRRKEVSITAEPGGWANGWTIKQGAMVLGKTLIHSDAKTTSTVNEIVYRIDGHLKPPADVEIVPKLQIDAEGTASRCVSFDLGGLPKTRKLKQGETC